MARLWLTRPRQYAEKTAEALAHHDIIMHPLLEYNLLPPPLVDVDNGAVVAFTSAFAVDAYTGMAYNTNIRAFCVGDSTAQTAKSFGMQVLSANGDIEALQKLILTVVDKSEKIWHFAALETAGDLQGALQSQGYQVEKVAIYETKTCQMLDNELCKELLLGTVNGVLLYSPKTAATFMELIKPFGGLPKLEAYCLSQNVADKIAGVGGILVADKPTEASLISLINQRFETE